MDYDLLEHARRETRKFHKLIVTEESLKQRMKARKKLARLKRRFPYKKQIGVSYVHTCYHPEDGMRWNALLIVREHHLKQRDEVIIQSEYKYMYVMLHEDDVLVENLDKSSGAIQALLFTVAAAGLGNLAKNNNNNI